MTSVPPFIFCPGCQNRLETHGAEMGQKVRCQHCQCKFLLADSLEILEPPTVVPQPAETVEATVAISQPTPAPPALPSSRKKSPAKAITSLAVVIALIGAAFYLLNTQSDKNNAAESPLADSPSSPLPLGENYKIDGEISGIKVISWATAPELLQNDPWITSIASATPEQLISSLRDRLDQFIPENASATDLTKQADSKESVADLMRYEIIRLAGAKAVGEILARPQGKEFIQRLFSNPSYMEIWLGAENAYNKTSGSHANSLHNALTIYRYDKRCWEPLYWKLACAYARGSNHSWDDLTRAWSLLDSYQTNVRLHKEGRLHAGFDQHDAWEMTLVTLVDDGGGRTGDGRSMEAFAYGRHSRRHDYTGACWEIPYVGTNAFGDSCQGGPFYSVWNNAYVRGATTTRKVAGVCGTLSTYGAHSARTHGIPSFPVGQPGHCAYMLRLNDTDWTTPYSVTWPTSTSSLYGHGDESIVRLMQAAQDDKLSFFRSSIHDMQRRYIIDRYTPLIESSLVKIHHDANIKNSVESLDSLKPVKSATINGTNLLAALKDFSTSEDKGRGAILEATFTLKAATSLDFNINSDDGSRVWLNDKLIIDNNGVHAAVKKSVPHNLPAGKHRLKIAYFDQGPTATCDFTINARDVKDTGVKIAAQLRVKALPLDLNGWRDIIADASTDPSTTPQDVRSIVTSFAAGMQNYPHPMLSLFKENLAKLVDKHFTGNDRCDVYLSAFTQFRPAATTPIRGHFVKHLEWVSSHLADDAQSVRLFRGLINHYKSSPAETATIVAWGNAYLMRKPAVAKEAAEIIAKSLSRNGNPNQIIDSLFRQLNDAAQKEDIDRWKTLNHMVDIALPNADQATWRSSKPEIDGKMPEVHIYPGKLLSADGLLKLSSVWSAASALTHQDAISAKREGGMIHTHSTADASVTLVLPGKAKLSGISLVNRFDGPPNRVIPVQVQISDDGKVWQTIYTSNEVKPVWEIDLVATQPEAKYIRVSRSDTRKEFLNFRALRVWGNPLY